MIRPMAVGPWHRIGSRRPHVGHSLGAAYGDAMSRE
jgi:hypothetical protein